MGKKNRKEPEMMAIQEKKRSISSLLSSLDRKFGKLISRLNQLFRRLDDFVAERLRRLDEKTANKCNKAKRSFEEIDRTVWYGGSRGMVRRRTGSRVIDWIISVKYGFFQTLDRLDTRCMFHGRRFQARTCRVRSGSEKKIANYLDDHGIKFRYEQPLILGIDDRPLTKFFLRALVRISFGPNFVVRALVKRFNGILFYPDFYLVEYDTYVEFWGLADSDPDYNENHRGKLGLYHKYGIRIISLYPRNLSGLGRCFPKLFKEVTGKNFPEFSK